MGLEIRFTARSMPAALLLLGAALSVPLMLAYWLGATLSVEEAERLARDVYEREASQPFQDRIAGGETPDAAFARAWNAALSAARRIRFRSVRVDRSLLSVIFSRRTTFMVEAWREGEPEPDYFRVHHAVAWRSSAFWWRVCL